MDLNECTSKNLMKQISPDRNLASSLLKSSSNRLHSQALLPLNEVTAASKVALTYDALRELLEAVAALKGYKVYNHECYCAFLREVLGESQLANSFDSFRKIRNSINYYGRSISAKEGSHLLNKMQDFITRIQDKFIKEK